MAKTKGDERVAMLRLRMNRTEVEKNKQGKKLGWKGTGYKYKLEQRLEERSGSAVPSLSQVGMEGVGAIV